MTDTTQTASWLEPVISMLDSSDRRGGYFVCFPQYRPDLVMSMAHYCGLELLDFRAEYLAPLGWDAAGVPLDTLDEAITEHITGNTGLVLQNTEALLAAVTPEIRQSWAAGFLERDLTVPVIIPIAVFSQDLPPASKRIEFLDPLHIPEEGLLMRLLET